MKFHHRFVAAPLLLAFAMVAACGAETREGELGPLAGQEDELNASCKYPRRYVAVMRDGECGPVVGARGSWLPSPLFPDAPPDGGSCIYSWSGEPSAPIDRSALTDQLRFAGALAPVCGPELGAATVHDEVFVIRGLAGAAGCDVCGLQQGGRIWVVLPPDTVRARRFDLLLSDSTLRSFSVEVAPGIRAASAQLPPLPLGTEYVAGRFNVY